MTDEQTTQPAPGKPNKPKGDRYVKMGFLAAVVLVAAYMGYRQYVGPRPPGAWQSDLPKALAQAREQNRQVVVLFYKRPPGEDYKQLVDLTLSRQHNVDRLKASNAILVLSAAPDSDPVAQKYNLRVRPTTLLLSPNGEEITRREGYIAETDLKDFLAGEPAK